MRRATPRGSKVGLDFFVPLHAVLDLRRCGRGSLHNDLPGSRPRQPLNVVTPQASLCVWLPPSANVRVGNDVPLRLPPRGNPAGQLLGSGAHAISRVYR